ncbi:hypothetical protein L249_0742 [Ophiocordyceps polyrhachis-furcata BCC 54312]|uniref:Dehydrogenase FUB6 n=1 Tax=Ophiocordyceps polyrhachis-furcata BCC 54312 TaxID=1330021 RepID=A0A367LCW1_9HYPO|nr:hypothetical protein L249_0742 [Ophiocordyceps polyrhachis-furcata BCC 54312]
MAQENVSYILAERPKADIIPGKTLQRKVTPMPKAEDLEDGQILVETLYLSLDPAMRIYMNGSIMRGTTACRVLASKSSQASAGDLVSGQSGWTSYAILDNNKFVPASEFHGLARPQSMLSVLGMTGMTAWVGMAKLADLRPGELVVVSAAAGATGSIAGQIAKIKGARVIGTAGGEEKCRWLTSELGFDLALDYKAADFRQRFLEATKDKIDVYFDNVGGETLEMCLDRANTHARFVECGLISQYNKAEPTGPRNLFRLVGLRIRMQGFIVTDHLDDYPRARKEMAGWVEKGLLKYAETITPGGLDAAEGALISLFKGGNKGKMLVELKKS